MVTRDTCNVPGCDRRATMDYAVDPDRPRRICDAPAHMEMAPRSLDALLGVKQEWYGDGRDGQ